MWLLLFRKYMKKIQFSCWLLNSSLPIKFPEWIAGGAILQPYSFILGFIGLREW